MSKKQQYKYIINKKIIIISALMWVVGIAILIGSIVLCNNISYVSLFCEIIVALTSMLGAIGIVSSMKKDCDLDEAKFIVELNNSFIQNSDFYMVYDFWDKYHDKKSFKSMPSKDKKELPTVISLTYKYLDFFEPLYLLVKKKIVEIETVEELFEYRFCVVVNNWGVQHYVLNSKEEKYLEKGYYDNIINLYCIIKEYKYNSKRLIDSINMPLGNNDLRKYAVKCGRIILWDDI